jgi:protein SCO1/2
MNRSFWLLAIGVLTGLVIAVTAFSLQPHAMRGSVIDPPIPAPEIALGDFRLSEQRGKTVLLFFGYTYCPDVCPATLGEIKQVLKGLGASADRVTPVFITVDPKRDTPEKLAGYTAAFDPRIVGLTGSLSELETVWQAYGVYRAEQPAREGGQYLVDHSARLYLIDPQGKMRATYAFGTPVEDLLSDVRYIIRNNR